MFLVIKKKTPVSRNSVLEKVETQILPAWWLLIWGTQVEVLGILFPFCVVFFHFFILHHTPCAQPTSILSRSGTLRTGESPTKHLHRLTVQRKENVFSHLISPGRGETFPGKPGWHTGTFKSSFQGTSYPLAAIHGAPSKFPGLCTIITRWIPAPELLPQAENNAQCQHILVPRTTPGPLGTEDAQPHDLSENTGAVAT